MYSIQTTKKGDTWYCYLLISYESVKLPFLDDTVKGDSYTDVTRKAADKGWMDLINKNNDNEKP